MGRGREGTPVRSRRQHVPDGAPLPLPATGSVVEVVLDDSHRWPTRLETRSATEIVVVAPARRLGDAILPPIGARVDVVWTTEIGEMVARGALSRIDLDVVHLWVVQVHRVERYQRRAAYRLPIALRAVLRPSTGPIDATTADLSEGGLRLRLATEGAPVIGDEVDVGVHLPTGAVVLARARIVRSVGPVDGEIELGLAFVAPDDAAADLIRRFVIEEQLRRRATSR